MEQALREEKALLLSGNQAAAYGAYLSRVQVIAAYPITPQTTIIETLADIMTKADWKHKFINVESEHSAMACCIGASMGGVRAYTATSAQGLALMHELLHWASGARLPIVLVNVNRAMAPGWSIWSDQNDSLSQRDTGWIQLYCESPQEVLDTVIQGFMVAEKVNVPVMVVEDAFILSHTSEVVELPDQAVIDRMLPPRAPAFRLDMEQPAAFGGLLGPEYYQEVRAKLHKAMEEAGRVLVNVDALWQKNFGRSYGIVEPYRCEDADLVLVTSGAISSTSKIVIDQLRRQGRKIGRLKIKLFRPFPFQEIQRLLGDVPKVAIIDRNCSYGHHGIFFQEIKSALYGSKKGDRPKLYGYILGLGGRDVTINTLRQVIDLTSERDEPDPETIWVK
ncbi:MAG: pyruvate ferredoxin oxidoreductase [Acidobacteria bacterium]|nr:pyruvate ferredoxin oxidoreductase [Acidobacteriota bacterium]MBI3654918.1 pyruvate ferredoxin oxidoreductase [Acidobacteriota bacterium]